MRRFVLSALVVLSTVAPALSAATPTDGFAAHFVEKRSLPGFDTPLVSHGVIRFDKDQGFHWEITRPYHYVFEMQDGQATETLPDGTTRQLEAADTPWINAVQRIFVSALSGNRKALERYFEVTNKPAADGAGRHVTLVPRSGAMSQVIKRIQVYEAAPGQPRSLRIMQRSGGSMSIRFTPIGAAE